MELTPERSERSHYVRVPADWIAGCSDAGRRHDVNQDALSLAVRETPPQAAVLAVADGVSTTPGSDRASLVAAQTAVDSLIASLRAGIDPGAALGAAFDAANDAVHAEAEDPAACTLIVAVIEDGLVTVGNVGDSRAYLVSDDGTAALLSTDDSMAQARIMLGMSRDDAEQSAQAHAITKWLGRQSTDTVPSVTSASVRRPGWLLLCSDGLWNYASDPADMGRLLLDRATAAPEPGDLAESLVDWANEQGGKDNITVALARVS